MDSFIEKRQEAIKSIHITMMIKYSLCIFLLLSLPLWISSIKAQPGPETWQSMDIVCSEVSIDKSGKEPYAIVKSEGGLSLIFDPALVSPEAVSGSVSAGDECHVVYSDVGNAENKLGKALSVDGESILDEEHSAGEWTKGRRLSYLAIAGTIVAAGISALLIDRVWCKNDHAEIKRLREEINKREERNAKRAQ